MAKTDAKRTPGRHPLAPPRRVPLPVNDNAPPRRLLLQRAAAAAVLALLAAVVAMHKFG